MSVARNIMQNLKFMLMNAERTGVEKSDETLLQHTNQCRRLVHPYLECVVNVRSKVDTGINCGS